MAQQSGCSERGSMPTAERLLQLAVLRTATPLSIQSRGHHFFPASGYRNNNSGDLNNVGTNGYCWSSTASDDAKGRRFNFNSSDWNFNENNRTNGYPVRAVAAFTSLGTLPSYPPCIV